MGAALAGSDGWLPTEEKIAEKRISNLLSGDLPVDELDQMLRSQKQPNTVTVGVHNGCNLACEHCYWQPQYSTGKTLSVEEQKTLIESVIEINPSVIVLCGKEVLLGSRGVELLFHMNNIRQQKKADFRMGIITNGTLLHLHKQALIDCELDYIDISMDGTESDHDSLRGEGAFLNTVKNLEWALDNFENELFITLTISRLNQHQLPSAIKLYESLGITNICMSFYKLLPYTSQEIALEQRDIEQFFENLSEFEDLSFDRTVNLIFDLDLLSFEAMKIFFKSDWFGPDLIQYDPDSSEYYIEHYVNQHVRLVFRLSPYPVGIWKVCRITPEGNYLAAEDMLNMELYPEKIISNARDFNFNFEKQHLHALKSVRFKEIMDEYKINLLPKIRNHASNNNINTSEEIHEVANY